jgi:hypothetical protein
MAKTKKRISRILSEVREAAKDLHEAGVVDAARMHEFDVLCRCEVPVRRSGG